MKGATKQDLLNNIPGKFGLLTCSPIVIDDDVIVAAGKSLSVLFQLNKGKYDKWTKIRYFNYLFIICGFYDLSIRLSVYLSTRTWSFSITIHIERKNINFY